MIFNVFGNDMPVYACYVRPMPLQDWCSLDTKPLSTRTCNRRHIINFSVLKGFGEPRSRYALTIGMAAPIKLVYSYLFISLSTLYITYLQLADWIYRKKFRKKVVLQIMNCTVVLSGTIKAHAVIFNLNYLHPFFLKASGVMP